MNELIPGALFSLRAAKESRLRETLRGEQPRDFPVNLTDYSKSWSRVAEGLAKMDSALRVSPGLFYLASHEPRTEDYTKVDAMVGDMLRSNAEARKRKAKDALRF